MHYAAPSAQDPFCAGKSSEAWDVGVEGTQEVLETEKHYQAVLQVCSADEEFRLKEQWVVFRISPRNAMVRVDGTLVSTRNGEASFYLPLGKHPYKVESPFYRAVEDSFSLDETARKVIELELQPVYSYLTVSAPWEEAEILVDGNRIGSGEATSGRLMAGNHRVEVIHDSGLACCRYVSLGEVEKKHVVFVAKDFLFRIERLSLRQRKTGLRIAFLRIQP